VSNERWTGGGRWSGSQERGGFTLIELLIGVIVATVILSGVYKVQVVQTRMYGKQREVMDVHGSLRSAAALLSWEVRQSSAAGGDIYAIGANSIALRSVQGVGTVCVRDSTLSRFGIVGTIAAMTATGDDSVLVYAAASSTWKVLRVTDVDTPASLGVGNCDWSGSTVPDIAVALGVTAPSDTTGIRVGAPIRAFRRVEYGIYQDVMDGRWWLGRKVGAATSYTKLTGPLMSQSSGGLLITYHDSTGAPTADPTQVATIDLTLRAESFGETAGQNAFEEDSLKTRVALRN
jgi:prepilin-type N-terminal cleavage/methylation domain-containing protein